MCAYICVHVYVCTCVCMVDLCECMHVCMICLCEHIHVHMMVSLCACMRVCARTHIRAPGTSSSQSFVVPPTCPAGRGKGHAGTTSSLATALIVS